jgi:hypothetical protein
VPAKSRHIDSEFYEIDSDDLLRFAEAYASLGDAVTSQIADLLVARYDDVNPNAVDLIRERLGGFNQEIDEALQAFDQWQQEPSDDDKDAD